jgi:hypothetical protein
MNMNNTLSIIARTLEQIAFDGMTGPEIMELAQAVKRQSVDDLAWCCVVCEEVNCDSGCPMADMRSGIHEKERVEYYWKTTLIRKIQEEWS